MKNGKAGTLIRVVAALAIVLGMHEGAHTLVLLAFGVKSHLIFTIPLFVGVKPNVELVTLPAIQQMLVAVAGPMVNIGLTLIVGCWLVGVRRTFRFLNDVFQIIIRPRRLASELRGPVGIYKQTKAVGFTNLLLSLSLSIGAINLIPFPPTDGWKIVRPLVVAVVGVVPVDVFEHVASLALLIFIGYVVLWRDFNSIDDDENVSGS